MENLVQCEVCPPHRQPGLETSYIDFLATHPLTFVEVTDPLEADNCFDHQVHVWAAALH
jgi:hypothetical protein